MTSDSRPCSADVGVVHNSPTKLAIGNRAEIFLISSTPGVDLLADQGVQNLVDMFRLRAGIWLPSSDIRAESVFTKAPVHARALPGRSPTWVIPWS